MRKVTRGQILDYRSYSDRRNSIRAEIMRIKEPRRIHLGQWFTFLFENTDTIGYQIQEMMRIVGQVREADILREMATYNELLGEDGVLGCCLLIEIDSPEDRKRLLREWLGLEKHLYLRLEDGTRIKADYDPRQVGGDRLSSVQYLKFKVGEGKPVAVGSDFPGLELESQLSPPQRQALNSDLKDSRGCSSS